jgi:transcriptional regulator with XRE-family HTH domain
MVDIVKQPNGPPTNERGKGAAILPSDEEESMDDHELRQGIGGRIKDMRKQRHWTQKDLATKLEVSVSILNKYEGGANTPPLQVLLKLSALFGTSLDYLVAGVVDEKSAFRSKRLADRVRDIEALAIDQQEMLIGLIDAVVTKNRIQAILAPEESRTATP